MFPAIYFLAVLVLIWRQVIGAKPNHQHTAVPTDFDLDLKSEWYAKSPPIWPPPHLKHNKQFRFNGYSTSWTSYDGHRHTNFTGVIVHSKLAKSKIHITYDGAEPRLTAQAEQMHYPPPKSLNKQELDACQRMYNEKIAKWCEKQKGTQVGNGECWTLANDALKAVAEDCKKHGEEECMPCIGFVHGCLLYEQKFRHQPHVGEAGIARGDVVQFYEAKFEGPHGWKSAGSPDHTSVVVSVEGDGELRVLEQNNGVDSIVREGSYNLAELTGGEVSVFRPVGTSWMGDLSPNWP